MYWTLNQKIVSHCLYRAVSSLPLAGEAKEDSFQWQLVIIESTPWPLGGRVNVGPWVH